MDKSIATETERRLSHINAKLADALELLETSKTKIERSCDIVRELEGEIEEIYLSIDAATEKEV